MTHVSTPINIRTQQSAVISHFIMWKKIVVLNTTN